MRESLRCGLVLACLAALPLAAAADVPAMEDGPRLAREAKLKQRAREWLKLKARLRQKCPRCGGVGKTTRRGGRHPGTKRTCSHCRGGKYIVDGRTFMRVYHEYRSPAFRAQDGIKAELDAKWRRYIPHGTLSVTGREFVERFEIVDVALLDATHGVVRAWIDKHRSNPSKPEELRWVWSSEKPGRAGHWYVWDGKADGPWPDSVALAPYAGARDMGSRALEAIRAESPESGLHVPTHVHKRDRDLVVTLEAKGGHPYKELRSALSTEALLFFRLAFGLAKRWDRVTIVAAMTWRNELGETDVKPYHVLELTRAEWVRLVPENLDANERLRAFDAENPTYYGWTHWK
jgi:hypothetical protein